MLDKWIVFACVANMLALSSNIFAFAVGEHPLRLLNLGIIPLPFLSFAISLENI